MLLFFFQNNRVQKYHRCLIISPRKVSKMDFFGTVMCLTESITVISFCRGGRAGGVWDRGARAHCGGRDDGGGSAGCAPASGWHRERASGGAPRATDGRGRGCGRRGQRIRRRSGKAAEHAPECGRGGGGEQGLLLVFFGRELTWNWQQWIRWILEVEVKRKWTVIVRCDLGVDL